VPPHIIKTTKNIDLGGYFPSKQSVENYSLNITKKIPYHNDRLRALNYLIQKIKKKKLAILDFGCGDGLQFLKLKLQVKYYYGIDASYHMIEACKKNLSHYKKILFFGGVEKLKKIKSHSIDLLIANNVLGYLTEKDLKIFLKNCKRIVKKNGYVMTLNGNELFNLFALNYGTKMFFEKYFNQKSKHLKFLLKKLKNEWTQAKTFNPLNFSYKFKKFNFTEIERSYAGWHKYSPEIGKIIYGKKDISKTRKKTRDLLFNPNKLKETDNWQCLFRCSIFGNLFKKNS
jgi:ubiquinone/menaquinone biosynthesis C-methylase UbiE